MAARHALKNNLVACLGEFVGTFMFLFMSFAAAQTAGEVSSASNEKLTALLYICLSFGLSLVVNVWLFFRISGGLFNPAVTLALALVGAVPPLRSCFIFAAQIVGGIAAAGLAEGLIPESSIMFSVDLAPGTSIARGLFLECFCTAQLVFAILMLAAEKTKATFLAPIGIGLSLFAAMLVSLQWTGGSLNPARAFGPAVVKGQFSGHHWLYWLGPVLGSLLAVGFYKLMKSLKYEEVNGDQDKSAYEEQFMPKEEVEGDVEKAGEQRRNSHRSSHSQHRSGSRVANTDRTLAAESSSSPHRYAARNSGGDRPIEYEGGDHPEPLGNGNSHRNSRAYVPEPAGLQYEEKLSRRDDQLAPTLPRTANGEPYIQHTDAQIRGIRRSSQRRHQRRLG